MKSEMFNRIDTILSDIAELSNAGGVYHSLHKRSLQKNQSVCNFCNYCLLHPATAPLCRYACCDATMHSISSGEPYFYRCWAGLLFVTVAIAPDNICQGGIALGGYFTEGEEKSELERTIEQRLTPLPNARLSDFLCHLGSVRPIAPGVLRGLGIFALESTFSSGINEPEFFKLQNSKYEQQRAIAGAVADVRLNAPSPPDILGDTYQLFAHLQRHDQEGAMRFSSKYLAKLLLMSNWNQDKLKAHLRALLAIFTSQRILDGISWQEASGRELKYLARLEQAHSTEDCCYEIARVIMDYFTSPTLEESNHNTLSERAINWLENHYADPVSLPELATAVGASISSLGHRLKRETGKSFSALLSEIRISAAKRLLATTDFELSEIAATCGFYDQSHFTRTMKKAISLTPGQFRSMLKPEEITETL